METFSICLLLGKWQVAIFGLTMKYLLSLIYQELFETPGPTDCIIILFKKKWAQKLGAEREGLPDLKDWQKRGLGSQAPRGQEGQLSRASCTFVG